MKNLLLAFAIILFSGTGFAQSHSDSAAQEEIDLLQAYYGLEKKVLTMEVIKITDDEKRAAFWKLYEEYEVKRKEIGVKRVALIEEYATKYETLDDATITKLTSESSALKIENIKLIDTYFAKIAKAVDSRKAAQFFQLENYLFTVLSLQISDSLPFVNSLEEHHTDAETPATK
jgi:hypothetical protein